MLFNTLPIIIIGISLSVLKYFSYNVVIITAVKVIYSVDGFILHRIKEEAFNE